MKKIFVIIVLMLVVVLSLTGCTERRDEVEEFEVYATNAPFGRYWMDFAGGGGFLCFSFDTDFMESYSIKYFDENEELKTFIIPSTKTNLHVKFTDDNTSMKFTIKVYYEVCDWFHENGRYNWEQYLYDVETLERRLYRHTEKYSIDYYLDIPRPELCRIPEEFVVNDGGG